MRQQGDWLRGAVRKFHRWLGLSFGALLVLLGLTGSVLAFYPELDAILHPEIRAAGGQMAKGGGADWDRMLATVRAEWPDKQGSWRFEVTDAGGAIPARYYDPPERSGHAFRPMMVWLSPDGAQVLRRDYWGEYAVTFIYDLHYTLLLGGTGGALVGWLGFGILVLLLTGLWAWWPRGSWAKALRFKPRAHPQRAWRDWHKLTGLSGLVFLVLLTVTGIMLALPEESDAALGAAGLEVSHTPHVHATGAASPLRTSPSHAITAAQSVLPGARLAWIETPPAAGGNWRLRMQTQGDPSYRFPHSFVWVHGTTGEVLAVQDAREGTAGTQINNWLHPLHDGSAGGLAGRLLAVLAGMVPALLFWTGWRRWRGSAVSVRSSRLDLRKHAKHRQTRLDAGER